MQAKLRRCANQSGHVQVVKSIVIERGGVPSRQCNKNDTKGTMSFFISKHSVNKERNVVV
jgi:hypothetical protein